PRGENGFGYDPLFWLPELQVSSAELSKEEKNKISHRGQAMQLFRESLQK
ncbi:non-canonical purine NTP pyrophosphatase, partial [Acinetobacter baumannii]